MDQGNSWRQRCIFQIVARIYWRLASDTYEAMLAGIDQRADKIPRSTGRPLCTTPILCDRARVPNSRVRYGCYLDWATGKGRGLDLLLASIPEKWLTPRAAYA